MNTAEARRGQSCTLYLVMYQQNGLKMCPTRGSDYSASRALCQKRRKNYGRLRQIPDGTVCTIFVLKNRVLNGNLDRRASRNTSRSKTFIGVLSACAGHSWISRISTLLCSRKILAWDTIPLLELSPTPDRYLRVGIAFPEKVSFHQAGRVHHPQPTVAHAQRPVHRL